MITGNKGEWSEIYTFLKVLDERKLYFADSELNRIEDKHYPVIGVLREEPGQTGKFYKFNGENIEITNLDDTVIGVVDQTRVKSCISRIFETIKESTSAFSIPLAEELMTDLKCTQIKAGNNHKADLTAKVRECGSPMIVDLGFSIKSMLGAPATLLNASGATNFIYRVDNFTGDYNEINQIDGGSKVVDKIKAIEASGGILSFHSMANSKFKNNLRKIDIVFPEIIATALKYFYRGESSNLQTVCELLANDEYLKEKYDLTAGDFEYKIKTFLRAVALGMMPSKEWDGLNTAHGGYLIVKEDGDVVCYHLFNMDSFQDYLFKNTKFETGGTHKHGFGKIYQENGELYIKLNLQIRFTQ